MVENDGVVVGILALCLGFVFYLGSTNVTINVVMEPRCEPCCNWSASGGIRVGD